MDFDKFSFVYNAEAHFKGVDKYPGGVMDAMQKEGTEGFNALCWLLAEMSMQGELIRRDMGYDKGEVLKEDYLRRNIKIRELNKAREIALGAIIQGLKGEDKEDDEIDEVLMELQKKTDED